MPGTHRPEEADEAIPRHEAWQCIGCGKIKAPQPCIGVCKDRKVTFVDAADFDQLRAERDALRAKREKLEALAALIACTTPREGEWERSWRFVQHRARELLADIG